MSSTFSPSQVYGVSSSAELSCAGLYRSQHPPTIESDLSNDLHPLFADDRFFLGDSFDLSKTLTARRFASRLIATPSLLPFWHTIFFTKKLRIMEVDSKGAPQHVLEEPPETLTATQAAKTKEMLQLLAGHVTFRTRSSKDPGTRACCTRDRRDSVQSVLPGSTSRIDITHKLLEDLLETQASDPATCARATFMFGVTLVHEVTHAAMNATQRLHGCDNFFFGESTAAEEGLEMESRAFGGLFRTVEDLSLIHI